MERISGQTGFVIGGIDHSLCKLQITDNANNASPMANWENWFFE